MNMARAFSAGVVGGIATTILGAVLRTFGMPVNLELMLGTMLLARGPIAWIVGLVLHLLVSGGLGLLYGVGFERVTHRAGAGVGVLFSVVHVLVAGVAMLAVPAVHRLIPEQMAAPGAFLSALGAGAVALFLIEHAMFGAIVGAIYGMEKHPAPPRQRAAT